MTVQSVRTIGQSNLDIECTKSFKMGGGHLGNKILDVNFFFSLVVPLDAKMNKEKVKKNSIRDVRTPACGNSFQHHEIQK